MQRVEKKVRVQLHPQGVEFGTDQLGAQFRRMDLLCPVIPVEMPALMRQQDHPVNEHLDVAVVKEHLLEKGFENVWSSIPRHPPIQNPCMNQDVGQREQE